MTSNGMKIDVKGDKLIIEVDVSKAAIARAQLSNSGKNKLLATTGGLKEFGHVKVGLNVTAQK
jgi:hypothetical protein